MADIKVSIRIEGLDEVQERLQYESLIAPSVERLLKRAALTIEGAAKGLAPVDTGRLRASITSVVEPDRAVVAPAVFYGAYVEFGTRPHWPPLAALQPWASRHGFPMGSPGAFLVARAIARHGTKPHPYMRPAAENSVDDIKGFAEDAAQEIQERWQRG